MIQKIVKNTLVGIVLLSMIGCAKVGTPTGGLKDEDAPIVIAEKPSNYSTYFQSEKVEIEFNEFIQLKDVTKEFSVSPPFVKKPNPFVKGKKVVVEFKDEKLDSTTYTLNFGNSIADFNEGNILENFQFVFSLNNYIDSMSVAGTLLNAFDLKTDKERLMVFLYNDTIDSIPYLKPPNYLSNTNEKGDFQINNLPIGRYKIFALKDANNNLIYDLPNEAIAFSKNYIYLHPDSFYIPEPAPTYRIDTIIQIDSLFQNDSFFSLDTLIFYDTIVFADTLPPTAPITERKMTPGRSKKTKGKAEIQENQLMLPDTDTTSIDSVMQPKYLYTYALDMVFFVEEFESQYLKDFTRARQEKIEFVFEEPVTKEFNIEPIGYSGLTNWYLPEHGKDGDTLRYWLTDSLMYANDSLYFKLSYTMLDSNGMDFLKQDTLLLKYLGDKDKGKGRSRKPRKKDMEDVDSVVIPTLALMTNINAKAHDLNQKIILTSETPVFQFQPDSVEFYILKDTLKVSKKITLLKDSTSIRKFYFDFLPEASESYKMRLLPGTFTDIYGVYNDTLDYNLTAQSEDYYGSINLNISGIYDPTIIQLLNEKEELLLSKTIDSDRKVVLDFIYPGKYLMKLFVDSNNNGKWDTGNYLNGLQPEKVIYYPGTIEVRSNWEMDLTWDIQTKVLVNE